MTSESTPSDPTPPGSDPPPAVGPLRETGAVRHESVRATHWTVDGIAKVTGPVEVETLEVRGSLSVGGGLTAGSAVVRGGLEVLGATNVRETLEVRGPARFDQGLLAGAFVAHGAVRAAGPVRIAGIARIDGEARFSRGAEFARLVARGGFECDGPLSGGILAFEVVRTSRIETIAAERVAVSRPPGLPVRIPGLTADPPTLTVLRIDAKEVRLEGTTVEVLAADRITLGPDCHVARAVGELVHVDRKAHVGPESRSPPPYGIWR